MPKNRKPDAITPQDLYQSRRKFLKTSLAYSSAAALLAACQPATLTPTPQTGTSSSLSDELGNLTTSEQDITGFTNYYEFSSSKKQPTELAADFVTQPWILQIGGW